MAGRACSYVKANGQRCGAPPLLDGTLCFWHSPEKAEDLADAQRMGGLRRKREKTVATAYSVDGLRDVDQLRRVLEIALVDTLSLDNGVPRNRTLITLVMTGLKALETGELEDRVAALEAAVRGREAPPVFDAEAE